MLILNLILGLFLLLQTTLFCSFSWLSDFIVGFPRWLCGSESTCQAGHRGSIPGSGRPLEKEMAPTPVFLPGKSHGRGALQDTVHGSQRVRHYLVTKEQTHHCT